MAAAEFEDELRGAAERWLAQRGARVLSFAGAENLVRPATEAERLASGGHGDPASVNFVLEVEGVPNLMHEFVHVLLHGRLEKDHGTHAADIPFDLRSDRGRRLLIEELTACTLSCAWHPGTPATMRDWFGEQVGIQHVFFGHARVDDFRRAATTVCRAHLAELRALERRATAATTAALLEAGAARTIAAPRHPVCFEKLWQGLVGEAL